MSVKEVIKKLNLSPSKEEFVDLKKGQDNIVKKIKNEIKKKKIKADVFLGGSFAKGTMLKSDSYDIDIFVRFDSKHNDISDLLEKIVKGIGYSVNRVHGSRDYFRIENGNITFEIIPVKRISKPKDSENVTDLSYFHVSYVKKKINPGIIKEIQNTKAFLKSTKLYGAESYIQGISGYGVECLMIYYKSLEKMAKEFVKSKDKIFIDIERKYKNKESAFIELNESKISPIVLIDPTWKERNVLAALSQDSFNKLKLVLSEFIKRPSEKFFEIRKTNLESFSKRIKNKDAKIIKIILKTDKQPGDIAGTKMKKFSNIFVKEISSYVDIIDMEFEYNGGDSSELYIAGKSKKEIMRRGPPINMKKNVIDFKKSHIKTIVRGRDIFAVIKLGNVIQIIDEWKKNNIKKIKEMDITEIKIN